MAWKKSLKVSGWDGWNKDETTCTYLESDTLQVVKRDLPPSLFLSVAACSN
jgi:hypothetical protein